MIAPSLRWTRFAVLAAAVAAATGCAAPGSLGRMPTEADFMTIQPGMAG